MIQEIQIGKCNTCVGYIPEIEYARRPNGPTELALHLQILKPMNLPDGELLPLVIFFVGGGYRTPKVRLRLPWLTPLAQKGFVVAMPEYRGTESCCFPAMAEDACSAVRYLRTHAKRYGSDPNRIVLAGGSAGAHLALLAALAGEHFVAEGDDSSISTEVCGVIDIYGPTDCSRMELPANDPASMLEFPPMQLVKCFDQETLPKALEPTCVLRYVHERKICPPILIAHGDADKIVPISQSELLYQALCETNNEAEFYRIKGADHADFRFFQEEMMERYASFIRRVTTIGQ